MNPRKKLSFVVTNYNVCLWPLCMLVEILSYKFSKLGGPNIGEFKISEWKNRVNRVAVDKEEYNKATQFYLNRLEEKQNWYREKIVKIPEKCHELIKFTSKVFAANLRQSSDKELYDLYKKYQEKFTEMYIYGWLPNAPEGISNLLTKRLEEILKKKLKRLGKEERMGEYLSILVTPVKDSIRRKESKEFLRLLKMIKKDNAQKDRLLERHTQKYAWLSFDYDGPALNKSYFVSLLESMLKQGFNSKQELLKLGKEKKDLIKKQKTYKKELSLDKKEQQLFEISRELMYWKDYRKDILFQSYYHIDKLIREIGRRLGLSPYQVKHILPNEMKRALMHKKYNPDELNKRIKYSVLVFDKRGVKIFTGKKAGNIKNKYTVEKAINKEARELCGECAYPGEASGQVKIVNIPSDISKMKPGNILVSVATNPNLLSAMKIAGAIVTDKGGITCHAAIISREFKKPCVTGTKIATQVFKDGDLVEIDATKGIVRKIK